MTETLLRARLRHEGKEEDEIEDLVSELADRHHDEKRERDLEDKRVLKLAEYYEPY